MQMQVETRPKPMDEGDRTDMRLAGSLPTGSIETVLHQARSTCAVRVLPRRSAVVTESSDIWIRDRVHRGA